MTPIVVSITKPISVPSVAETVAINSVALLFHRKSLKPKAMDKDKTLATIPESAPTSSQGVRQRRLGLRPLGGSELGSGAWDGFSLIALFWRGGLAASTFDHGPRGFPGEESGEGEGGQYCYFWRYTEPITGERFCCDDP